MVLTGFGLLTKGGRHFGYKAVLFKPAVLVYNLCTQRQYSTCPNEHAS